MIDIEKLANLHNSCTAHWHNAIEETESFSPWIEISNNHLQNFLLWHEEDIARRDDLPDAQIKQAKRKIDKFNQLRNNAMEQIDDWILSQLVDRNVFNNGKQLHSETPGMMIDRLSIMALKIYHMQEQVDRVDASLEHRDKCNSRVSVLREQIHDLSNSLARFLSDLSRGERRFKVYRQFKMYNDPNTNPQLYSPDQKLKSFE